MDAILIIETYLAINVRHLAVGDSQVALIPGQSKMLGDDGLRDLGQRTGNH